MRNILIAILLILITAFSYKYYITSQKKLKEELKYSKKIITLASEINALKNRYKPYIPPFCKKEIKNTIHLTCNNLNKLKFFQLQNTFKKSYLITFDIQKKSTKVEIKK